MSRRCMSSDSDFYLFKKYVGSSGERVELQPGGGSRWHYRFSNDRRWRVAKDKFTALLNAAWERGKSGLAMAWEPEIRTRRAPNSAGRSFYKSWQKTECTEKESKQ